MKSIQDVSFKGKRVLMRVDFNVPLDENGKVTDDTRIRESIASIQKIVNDGAKLILMSHLGRPKGKVNLSMSLEPVAEQLSKLVGKKVHFERELISEQTIKEIEKLNWGDIMLLENIRFYAGEESGDEDFSARLASLGDAYVNDAFGTAHRAHASTTIVAKYFPKDKYFGYLMDNEIVNLEKVLSSNIHPYTAIIGGSKVSTKIDIIRNLIGRVDNMIIGGGMVFTFIKALGGNIGNSLFEEDKVEEARQTILEMVAHGVNLILPADIVAADKFANDANRQIVAAGEIPDGWMGLDIGPKAIKKATEVILNSSMVLWNGPMGVFEMDNFQNGTRSVAIAVATVTNAGGYSAIGGGDSVAAINKYDLSSMMSYISTGGGAMLEYLEGLKLPGIAAIED
ncbi:MAG: phosphoglycerate kinase [Bacteroidales bacterium]|nr:phosphoglycerate kinase [Bacteroidales bacterium]